MIRQTEMDYSTTRYHAHGAVCAARRGDRVEAAEHIDALLTAMDERAAADLVGAAVTEQVAAWRRLLDACSPTPQELRAEARIAAAEAAMDRKGGVA